ncbi:site-specific DNA-methyltransferase [Hymenobacter setariae]|uniref:Methyltransferase n=1 Tax=Hymenobacter setariae TaxID=2594794 RepID=A0A558BSZ8_9BACT|nr:site-specific DNA-methyltransferase [Hymenobacter setariae]TVT39609.1 site-specific DNA-methyltransferase [Hymenobacter setariae]
MLDNQINNHHHLQSIEVLEGNARHLDKLSHYFPAQGFDVIVTSPPYWQRRDYEHPDQLGQEKTPEQFVETLADTVAGWAQWLASHGSIFINLADTHYKGFLVGVPILFEIAMRKRGWHVAHRVIWSKPSSVPTSSSKRLASRHETVLQLVAPRKRKSDLNYYFDRFALTKYNPKAEIGDVWHVSPSRRLSGHVAPFPVELVRRILLLACPEQVCETCGKPFTRLVGPSEILDDKRPQARRAMELFQESGLTKEHLAAIRAVGISDAGMGKKLQKGSGRNSAYIQKLAIEAKAALGGYFREYTFAPKEHLGWETCSCNTCVRPGWVLDPFAGSNTSLYAAQELGFRAVGVDLTPHPLLGR